MFTLTCRDTGLDCDFVIKGETMKEFLKSGANHAVEKHGMREEDFYLDGIPANLLCHSFIEETND
jgi:predicted small metal-binding protein